MNDLSPIPVTWKPREKPLVATAVVARGAVALNLARWLLDLDKESLGGLKGVAGAEILVLIGEEESLPWVDGVTYIGRDPIAPSLLVPTTLEPSVPLALLERALSARCRDLMPLAVLADVPLVVPIGSARPVVVGSVRQWLESRG